MITSNSPNFVAWHPATEEIEVYFENRFVSGQPTASGIEMVNDGTDTAFGTLLFNVIEMVSHDGLVSKSSMSKKHPLHHFICYHTFLIQTRTETLPLQKT